MSTNCACAEIRVAEATLRRLHRADVRWIHVRHTLSIIARVTCCHRGLCLQVVIRMSHVVKCLVDVPHLHMKRPYTLSNGTFEDLKQAIAVCPLLGNLVALSTSRFQVMDVNFNEYIDLGPGDDIPHMAKIKLLPSSLTPLDGSSASTCEIQYPEEQVPEKSSFFDLEETSGIELTELSSCADDHGSSFVLPSFGALHNIITSGEPITSSLQRNIVDVLFGEMLKFTIVPTPQFYSRVAFQLLQKYPNLADGIGTGYDSWKIALRNKFKNARRHMTADERLKENKEKFGTNKASTRESDDKLRRNKKAKKMTCCDSCSA